MGLVGQEPDGQVVLLFECVLRLHRISRDPKNIRAGFVELGAQLRKVDRLAGATGGTGAGLEIDDELAALEVGQRNTAATVTWRRKCRGFVSARELIPYLRLPFVI